LDAFAIALELGQPVAANRVSEDDAPGGGVRSDDGVAALVAGSAQRVNAGIVAPGQESRTKALKVSVVRNAFEAVDDSVSGHPQSILAA
jgi:phosphoribosylformimino-5-aminoimidazole carboxamide ribonucleotide (ProFAR) isomerase